MTVETQTYPDIIAWRSALEGNRGGGWHIISNSRNKLNIIWSNDPPPSPPPKRQLNQGQFLAELASERGVEII